MHAHRALAGRVCGYAHLPAGLGPPSAIMASFAHRAIRPHSQCPYRERTRSDAAFFISISAAQRSSHPANLSNGTKGRTARTRQPAPSLPGGASLSRGAPCFDLQALGRALIPRSIDVRARRGVSQLSADWLHLGVRSLSLRSTIAFRELTPQGASSLAGLDRSTCSGQPSTSARTTRIFFAIVAG